MCCWRVCPAWAKRRSSGPWARSLKLDFKRVQFTPDLAPGDVLGALAILQETSSRQSVNWCFSPGLVFTNILLADEVNRASPKTQSAMLETMQENSVTLLGTTRALPQPFFVLASQNCIRTARAPIRCPEAQSDRFLVPPAVRMACNTDVLEQTISSERRRGELPAPILGRWSAAQLGVDFFKPWGAYLFAAPCLALHRGPRIRYALPAPRRT